MGLSGRNGGGEAVIRWLCSRATYANAMASAAMFIAVGGTSYAAITLPRNSVGERQIKPRAVGSGKLKTGAVRSRAIRDGAIKVQDLARTTKQALTGAPGPPGAPGAPAVTLRASVSSTGALVAGNASSSDSSGVGRVSVRFPRGLAGCVPVATLP